MIGLSHYLAVGGALFGIGLYGALSSRSVLRVVICVELMLNAVNINFAAFALFTAQTPEAAYSFIVFLIVVAAAELGVALALIVALGRFNDISSVADFSELRG